MGANIGDAAGLATGGYREYRLENDQQARVRAYGMADCSNAASGPAYFKVWTNTGEIVEYGDNRTDCSVATNALITASYTATEPIKFAQEWRQSRISDIHGNHVDFKYQQRDLAAGSTTTAGQNGHEWLLSEIQYSGNKIVFRYSDRSTAGFVRDISQSYQAGSKTIDAYLLQSITTYVNAPSAIVGDVTGAVAVITTKLIYDRGGLTQRSRLHTLQSCAGDVSSTLCQPAETFGYSMGGAESYQASPNFNLGSENLFTPVPTNDINDVVGNTGVLTADFDGDGKTDILVWSANPTQIPNQLWHSNGDGTFTQISSGTGPEKFNLGSEELFSLDGCETSLVMDFNNDGLPDILRYSGAPTMVAPGVAPNGSPNECTPSNAGLTSVLYLNNGDGSFTKVPLALKTLDGSTQQMIQNRQETFAVPAIPPSTVTGYYWNAGSDFFLLDVNGDGILDLVTTIRPAYPYSSAYQYMSRADECAKVICTRVFLGDGHGNFNEMATNLAHYSLFRPGHAFPLGGVAFDQDQDGLPDLNIYSGGDPGTPIAPTGALGGSYTARSRGDGNFDLIAAGDIEADSQSNSHRPLFRLNFIGDGNLDFMSAEGVAYIQGGPGSFLWCVTNPIWGGNLLGIGASSLYLGATGTDVIGDGRDDIVSEWGAAYISNGDGSFTTSSIFNTGLLRVHDSASHTTQSYTVGHFTGSGQAEFLTVGPNGNKLWVKTDPSMPDLLTSVTDHNGRKTSYTYVPLSNPWVSANDPLGPRYVSDLTNPAFKATGTQNDRSPTTYVVATVKTDDGVGGTRTEEYSYTGLKVDTAGRGSLGFRIVRHQAPAPNGVPHTSETTYLQSFPYIGMPATQSVYSSALNAVSTSNLLSRTTNVYCDQTAAADADNQAVASGVPCTSSAVIRRPYAAWSQSTSQDPSGNSLGTQTTRTKVDANLEPLSQSVVKTLTNSASDTYTQNVTVVPYPDNTSCSDYMTCNWILSRPQTKTTEGIAPTTMLATSTGTAPLATATQGMGTLPPTVAAAVTPIGFTPLTVGGSATLTSTVTNSGSAALTLTTPGASSVTGTDFSFVSTTCSASLAANQTCSITVAFKPTAVASRTGSVSVATSAGAFSAYVSGAGLTPTMAFTPQSASWGTVGIASDSGDWPTITNTSSVPVLITAHAAVSGPTGTESWAGATGYCMPGTTVLQPGANCKTFFGMGESTAVGSFTAVDQISYQAVGVTASTFNVQQTYTYSTAATVASASTLAFAGTTVNTTSAQQTFTITNNATASPVNITVSESGNQPANFPMTNNCGANLAAGASCTVTVSFNPTWIANGFSAGIQIATTYPRMTAGAVEAYYYQAPTSSVALSGNGLGSAATLTSASTQSVPATWYGGAAQTVMATYRNDGNQPLTLASPALSAPLSVSSNNCSSIAAGSSCSMVITAATNVAGISQSQTFAPSGANIAPAATTVTWTTQSAVPSWSPANLTFGTVPAGTSATQNITLTNNGNVAYDWAANSGIANAPAGYTFNTSACSNVAPGSSCNVVVTFSPSTIGTSYSGGNISMAAASYNTNVFSVSGTGGGSSATLTSAATLAVPATWYGGATQTVTATYRNDGNMPMTLASPSLAAPLSVTGNNCAGVGAGASCSMVISAATNVAGISQSQTFTPTGASAAPAATTVTWTTQTAIPNWGAPSLVFGTVAVGSSTSQNISLTNSGNVAYNWAANNGIANAPTGYSFNTSACSSVSPGASCNVVVTFSPTVSTTYSGAGISMTAASYNANTFQVTGTGGLPVLSLSSTSLGLPNTQVGSANVSGSVTVTNTGNYAANAFTISAPASFGIVSSNCGTSLAAGAQCSFAVQFAPTAAGAAGGNVSVASQLASAAVSVSGQGVSPSGSLTAIAFGNVPSNTVATSTLANTGIGPLSISGISAQTSGGSSTPNPNAFSVASNACPASLAAGASCSVGVQFAPMSGVSSNGYVLANTNAGALTGSLSGTGIPATTVAGISSGSLAFGSRTFNTGSPTLSITVGNSGNSPMTLTGLSGLASPFSLTGNTCSSVAPGGSCVMTVALNTGISGSWSQSVSSVGATSNFSTTLSASVAGPTESGPWTNGATLNFCSGQFASITNTYSFTISGAAETATLSPATSSLYTITYPTSGSTAWTNGATLNPGTYSFTIRAPSPPSGQTTISMTFGGSGHVVSATAKVYVKTSCP